MLEHHLDHRVRRQRAVNFVKLCATGGSDGDGDAQIFAAFALAQLDGGGVKVRVKLRGNMGNGLHQASHFQAHDFDREKRRIDDQRVVL